MNEQHKKWVWVRGWVLELEVSDRK
jgi:hypothetical protein